MSFNKENRKIRIILKFEPNLDFDKEFVEFVEEVLKWSKERNVENGRKNQLKNKKIYGKKAL